MSRFAALLVALVCGARSVRAEDPAPASPVPFPTDGIDAPFRGMPAMPREWKDARGDLRVRTVRPYDDASKGRGVLEVRFDYAYADESVRKRLEAEGLRLGIEVRGFDGAGRAHASLHRGLRRMLALQTANTKWDEEYERLPGPGLFLRPRGPSAVGIFGVFQHTWIGVEWDDEPRGAAKPTPTQVEVMRRAVATQLEQVMDLVAKAPVAEAESPGSVNRVEVVSQVSAAGVWTTRLEARISGSREAGYPKTILWARSRVLTNQSAHSSLPPGHTIGAELAGGLRALENFELWWIGEGDEFHYRKIPLAQLPGAAGFVTEKRLVWPPPPSGK